MSSVRLTKSRVERLTPATREYSVQDTMVPSLSVRVYPSGTKTWVSTISGRKIALGKNIVMSLDDARQACLRRHVEGIAPRRDVPVYQAFVLNMWRPTWSTRCKLTTVKGRDFVLTRQLLPTFGVFRLDRITRKVIDDWFDAYSGVAPGGANFALQILRQSLNHALERDLIAINPACSVRSNRRPKMTRFLSRDEIRRLNAALDQYVEEPYSAQADIIRLLLLTGCRKMEIVGLKRREVADQRLRLEDSKTGPRTVYLSPEAQVVIERRLIASGLYGEYVFPSLRNPERPLSKNLNLWYRIRRDIGIEDVRLHDLRHSYASQCVMAGVPLPVVSRLLGHSQCSMTLRYAHVADKDIANAAERIGTRMVAFLNGE
ncbi:MAG: tyrosine-type recombinase/integrase [Aestuariivita sp.]|nr:tyrosine-type recombinase/integrase [Aestuariivita sp.]